MPRHTISDERRAQHVTLAVKLRFGPRGRDGGSQPKMTLRNIAAILEVSLTTVHGYLKRDALSKRGPLPMIRGRHPPLNWLAERLADFGGHPPTDGPPDPRAEGGALSQEVARTQGEP